mgnify:CR=1 FL=1
MGFWFLHNAAQMQKQAPLVLFQFLAATTQDPSGVTVVHLINHRRLSETVIAYSVSESKTESRYFSIR